MSDLLKFLAVFVVGGLAVWLAIIIDDYFLNRDAHRSCQLCHPELWEPPSRLDDMDWGQR